MKYKLCILVGKNHGESFNLEHGREYIIGRHSENDIRILDENISRNHLRINIRNNKYYVTDLYSKNGTFVDGKDLIPGEETEVKAGMPILIGMTILGFGEEAELSLKPFLDSAGLGLESIGYGEIINKHRVEDIKRNLQFIYKVNNLLTDSKYEKEVAEKLLDSIFDLLKRVDRCVIILFDDETGEISDIIYRSRKPVGDPDKIYNKELVEHAVLIKKPVIIKDTDNLDDEDEDEKFTESLQLMKIKSALCVPIVGYYGVRGAIYVDSLEKPNGFRVNDAFILKDASGRAAMAMDNVSLEKTFKTEEVMI